MKAVELEEGYNVGAGPVRRFWKGDYAKVLKGPHQGLNGVVTRIIGSGEYVQVKLADSVEIEITQRDLEPMVAPVKKAPPAQCAR